MRRNCEACDRPAKNARSRYCDSPDCERARTRERVRKHGGQVIEFPTPSEDGPVARTTRQTLTEADREDTPLGQAALVIAGRLDAGSKDTGSSTAALVRELRATLEAALKGAPQAADGVDELRARRERRHA